MSSVPVVRPACSDDIPFILSFIRTAAEEQSPGANVTATEQRLRDTLYLSDVAENDKPRFAWPILIFTPTGKAVGLLVYLFNFSTWSASPGLCLEELYVIPEYRRHGYARLLLEFMASSAKASGCVKMDWVCLQDNRKALNFYEKLGAKRMDDWVVLKVDQIGIERLAKGYAT